MLIKLTTLLDEAKCYEVIRQLRWPDGIVCLHCRGRGVVRNGHDDRERSRQRYWCKTCKYRFDDLTGTVLAACCSVVKPSRFCPYRSIGRSF